MVDPWVAPKVHQKADQLVALKVALLAVETAACLVEQKVGQSEHH